VLLNIFEVALHSAYLYLKVLAMFGVISVFNCQKDARNIELGFALGRKNIYFFKEASEHHQQYSCSTDTMAPNKAKPAIKTDCETKRVALDHRVPNKAIFT
jgi:hypothetical protein